MWPQTQYLYQPTYYHYLLLPILAGEHTIFYIDSYSSAFYYYNIFFIALDCGCFSEWWVWRRLAGRDDVVLWILEESLADACVHTCGAQTWAIIPIRFTVINDDFKRCATIGSYNFSLLGTNDVILKSTETKVKVWKREHDQTLCSCCWAININITVGRIRASLHHHQYVKYFKTKLCLFAWNLKWRTIITNSQFLLLFRGYFHYIFSKLNLT